MARQSVLAAVVPAALATVVAGASLAVPLARQKALATEDWSISPEFERYRPRVVAVVPMVNMTLDPEASTALYNGVYERLQAKGYQKIDVARVQEVMNALGVQVAEMLSGISYQRLGKELRAEAVIQGEVVQSGRQVQGLYDAVVVSCSLRMVHCETGKVLWACEQFRQAHRQWQADRFNLLINLLAHSGSRKDRIAWLAQEMFRTLPPGPIEVVQGDLLSKAVEISVEAPPETPVPAASARTTRAAPAVFVPFAALSADLGADAEAALGVVLPVIDAHPDAEVVFIGRAGSAAGGDAEALARHRARACRDWIVGRLQLKDQAFRIETPGAKGAATAAGDGESVEVAIWKRR